MYNGLYELSGIDIIRQLGKRFIDYRKRMGYTQKEVALKSGLSIFTIEIEKVSNAVGNFSELAVALDIENS
jgi:transcriptional regulator with XRE-family HTH domain